MQKLTITIALAVIALALGTMATTTTMQIQPAYSQASHCYDTTGMGPPRTVCVTPGKNPVETCTTGTPSPFCDNAEILTHQEAGQAIGDIRQGCAQGTLTGCSLSVGNPND
jgi:hypothetical protein